MAYDDESGDFEDSSSDYLDDANLEDDESVSDDQDVHRSLKNKDKNNEHALEVRRAIEDHLERSKLQKDLDYLFDDDFTEDE